MNSTLAYNTAKAFLLSFATLTFAEVASATSGHVFLVTESSSSSLTVTYDGTPVTTTLLGPDNWDFNLPDAVHLGFGEGSYGSPTGAAVTEPGGGTLGPWNNVFTLTTLNTPYVSLVTVTSDATTTSGFAVTLANDVSGNVGTDQADGLSIYLTFNDLGDSGTSTVPDGGTAGLMLGGALSILGLIRRKLA
ncbi:MAG TPA: hypothetical protein VMU04_06900 [Candidatus Acidoferrum sp.]|nr:hypothetical protein [Candidatus Acidoferrum sp.]